MPVSVTVQAADNEVYEIPGNTQVTDYSTRPHRDYLPIILASLALLVTLITGIFWIFQKNSSSEINKSSSEYRDKYYELLIEKKIDNAFEKEKLNLIIQKKTESISDSVQNLEFKEKN